jgi:hypothetical protein
MRNTADGFLVRLTRWAALSGGALLATYALLTAANPMPYFGAQDVLLVVALLLIAIAFLGLGVQARREGVPGAWWTAGAVLVALGVALVVLGAAANLFSEELPPLFVVPGVGCLAVGALLVGILVVRSGILSWYASTLLIVGALALPAFNDQNWQALYIVPFAVAWVVAGLALLLRGRSS